MTSFRSTAGNAPAGPEGSPLGIRPRDRRMYKMTDLYNLSKACDSRAAPRHVAAHDGGRITHALMAATEIASVTNATTTHHVLPNG